MFGDLRQGRRREIRGDGGIIKSEMARKKGEIRSFFRRKTQHNNNTDAFTKMKALSSGSSGSSGFTAVARRAVGLGVNVAVERADML